MIKKFKPYYISCFIIPIMLLQSCIIFMGHTHSQYFFEPKVVIESSSNQMLKVIENNLKKLSWEYKIEEYIDWETNNYISINIHNIIIESKIPYDLNIVFRQKSDSLFVIDHVDFSQLYYHPNYRKNKKKLRKKTKQEILPKLLSGLSFR